MGKNFGELENAIPPGDACIGMRFERIYIPCRLKMSSFSRHEQFVHSRQHTSRTATPRVTSMANTLAYEANQCNKLCIIHRGPRSHQTPLSDSSPIAAERLEADSAPATQVYHLLRCIIRILQQGE
jgi:hypothetical protein